MKIKLLVVQILLFSYCGFAQNIALNKPTEQSSTFGAGVSSRAVDGDQNGAWGGKSVTHTNGGENAWWKVDLGGNYNINAISFYNRTNNCCYARIEGAKILVGLVDSENPIDYTEILSLSATTEPQLFTSLNVTARYIMVYKEASENGLNIAEFEVYGELSLEDATSTCLLYTSDAADD